MAGNPILKVGVKAQGERKLVETQCAGPRSGSVLKMCPIYRMTYTLGKNITLGLCHRTIASTAALKGTSVLDRILIEAAYIMFLSTSTIYAIEVVVCGCFCSIEVLQFIAEATEMAPR